MSRGALYIGLGVTLALFAVGVALAITGLVTEYWMTYKTPFYDIRVGLFRICVDSRLLKYCVSIDDFDRSIASVKEFQDFLLCQICTIIGTILGGIGIVTCAAFFLFIFKGNTIHKGSYTAALTGGIGSVVCLVIGVAAFGLRIHKGSLGFDLDYSFILTCLAFTANLIGCGVLACAKQMFMKSLRGTTDTSGGIVFSAYPQFVPHEAVQYDVSQQQQLPAIQTDYNYRFPGPLNTYRY